MAGAVLPTASRAAAEGELVGEGFPVTDWQRGGADELR